MLGRVLPNFELSFIPCCFRVSNHGWQKSHNFFRHHKKTCPGEFAIKSPIQSCYRTANESWDTSSPQQRQDCPRKIAESQGWPLAARAKHPSGCMFFHNLWFFHAIQKLEVKTNQGTKNYTTNQHILDESQDHPASWIESPNIIVLMRDVLMSWCHFLCGSISKFNEIYSIHTVKNSCLCNGSKRLRFHEKVLCRNVFTEGLSESIHLVSSQYPQYHEGWFDFALQKTIDIYIEQKPPFTLYAPLHQIALYHNSKRFISAAMWTSFLRFLPLRELHIPIYTCLTLQFLVPLPHHVLQGTVSGIALYSSSKWLSHTGVTSSPVNPGKLYGFVTWEGQ